MKTITRLTSMLLLLAVLIPFTSCKKDLLYLCDPDDNVLFYGSYKQEMIVDYAAYTNYFNIAAESKGGFITPMFVFRFKNIPYEVLGKTIDLDKTSDYTLSFEFLNKVKWFTSPERVCGVINENGSSEGPTEYRDESPFCSGWIKLTEEGDNVVFVLHGVLKNGYTIRMKLVVPTT